MRGPLFGFLLLGGAAYAGYWFGKKSCARAR
jgi:hypothetical protein